MRVPYYVLLVTVLPAMTAASDDDVYLLATALYGTNAHGKHLLITGPLSPPVEDIIKNDLQARIHPKASIKVVPILDNTTTFPVDNDSRGGVLQKLSSYTNIVKADLSGVESRKMLKNFWYFLVEDRNRRQKKPTEGQETTTVMAVLNITRKKKSSQDDYLPNDIYYAIEKKCVNWADGCDNKSPSIMEMSIKNVNAPRVRLPKLRLIW